MTVDAVASLPHYMDHILPAWLALPAEARGRVLDLTDPQPGWDRGEVALVAGTGDVKKAHKRGYRRIIRMQHGIGQTYGGHWPDGNEQVGLVLCPNDYSRDGWAAAYPNTKAVTVGSPRAEYLRQAMGHDANEIPIVAISFHWLWNECAETRPAWGEYRDAIPSLMKEHRVLGHGHPRAWRWLLPWYKRWKLEVVPNFEDVVTRADVYVCDNSSTIYEFAALGRPVVVLNSKQYRRGVHHGLRFWEAATVGPQANSRAELPEAVRLALSDPPGLRQERERIVRMVYGEVNGSSARAAQAIMEWIQ